MDTLKDFGSSLVEYVHFVRITLLQVMCAFNKINNPLIVCRRDDAVLVQMQNAQT